MKKKEVQNESSVKIALRLKAFEREEKMIKVLDSNKIALTDEKTGNSEEFEYDRIFDMRQHNSDIFSFVKASTVGRIFDNTNCCVMCIGQAGSGKSFTLFGNDARFGMGSFTTDYSKSDKNVGLVIKVYHGLINSAMDFQDNKEYQILVSMMEVHKENVRDLLSGFEHLSKDKMNAPPTEERPRQSLENLEVYESANGQLMIKNLSSLHVDSEDDLIYMIAYGVSASKAAPRQAEQQQSHGLQLPELARHHEHELRAARQRKLQLPLAQRHGPVRGNRLPRAALRLSWRPEEVPGQPLLQFSDIRPAKSAAGHLREQKAPAVQRQQAHQSDPKLLQQQLRGGHREPRHFEPARVHPLPELPEPRQPVPQRAQGQRPGRRGPADRRRSQGRARGELSDGRRGEGGEEAEGGHPRAGHAVPVHEERVQGQPGGDREHHRHRREGENGEPDLQNERHFLDRLPPEEAGARPGQPEGPAAQRERHHHHQDAAQDRRAQAGDLGKARAAHRADLPGPGRAQLSERPDQNTAEQQAGVRQGELRPQVRQGAPARPAQPGAPQRQERHNREVPQRAPEARGAAPRPDRGQHQAGRVPGAEGAQRRAAQEAEEPVRAAGRDEAEGVRAGARAEERRSRPVQPEVPREEEAEEVGPSHAGNSRGSSSRSWSSCTASSKSSRRSCTTSGQPPLTQNDAYSSGLETINIPTEDIDRLHLPMREAYPHLYRTLDKIKISESKQESVVGLKKEETLASMAEEIRQNLTKTMQQQPPADPKAAGESKPQEEPSLMDLTGADLGKFDRKGQTELFRKMVKQIELQKLRIETLRKSEPNSIAEVQAILEDAKFYEGKLKRQQQVNRQTRGVIDSQARLLAKDGSKL